MEDHTLDLETLEGLTDPEQVRSVAGFLEPLKKDTELLVFVRPGCAVCPHQVKSAATVALASPHVTLEIVDAMQEPELAAQYEIRAVPTTVVDDELIMAGMIPPAELALRLVERQGPEEAKRVFTWLVESGNHSPAAERLADGRGTGAFVGLWAAADHERRAALLAMAEESLLYDPYGLNELVPELLEELDREPAEVASGGAGSPAAGEGPENPPPPRDENWREDMAKLLGTIGHPDTRPALERLAADPDRFVAKAAADGLAELDEAEE